MQMNLLKHRYHSIKSKNPCRLLLCLLAAVLISSLSGSAAGFAEEDLSVRYDRALELLYTRHFDEAHEAFLALGEYSDSARLAAFALSYPKSEPKFYGTLINDGNIAKHYQHGLLYSCIWGMFYIPDEVNTDTSFVLYYCGGGAGEDYLYYSGLYGYFYNYSPNAILFFCNESGYNHMKEKNTQMYGQLQQLACECGTIVHDLSTIGSSAGCYTALKAASQFYKDYGQIVNNVCTLDTGLYWDDPEHNLTGRECDLVAEAGTVFYLFEEPGVGIEVPALRQMVDHGIDVYVIGCAHDNHSVISQLAYTYGVFSWSAGEDIYLPEEEYTFVKLSAD